MNRTLAGFGYDFFNDPPRLLGLRFGGLNALVNNQLC